MGDVILFKEDVDQLNSLLKNLVTEAKILSVLLITKDTRVLAGQGTLCSGDTGALAALLVGSFASTQAIAGLIGETEFDTMTHHGKTRNIIISLIDDNTILTSLFDKTTSGERIHACVLKHIETLRKALRSIGANTTQDLFDTGASSSSSASEIADEFDLRADALHKTNESDQLKSSGDAVEPQFSPIPQEEIKRPPDTEMITIEQTRPEPQQQPRSIPSEQPKKNIDDSNRSRDPESLPDQDGESREGGQGTPSDAVHVSMNYLKNKTREGALYYHYDKAFFKKFFKSSHKKKP
jgi:predicted regulator of Ras-like GTPase activity (Roadblock/LC7/MglB family)